MNQFPAAPVMPASQPMGSPLASAMMGAHAPMPQMSNPSAGIVPLLSMLMQQRAQGAQGVPGGAGPGPASHAAAQAAWGGAPTMMGAGAGTGAPLPPGQFASMLPSWLGGPSASPY